MKGRMQHKLPLYYARSKKGLRWGCLADKELRKSPSPTIIPSLLQPTGLSHNSSSVISLQISLSCSTEGLRQGFRASMELRSDWSSLPAGGESGALFVMSPPKKALVALARASSTSVSSSSWQQEPLGLLVGETSDVVVIIVASFVGDNGTTLVGARVSHRFFDLLLVFLGGCLSLSDASENE